MALSLTLPSSDLKLPIWEFGSPRSKFAPFLKPLREHFITSWRGRCVSFFSEFEKKKTIFDQENIILKEDKKKRRKLKIKEAEKVAEFEKFLRNIIPEGVSGFLLFSFKQWFVFYLHSQIFLLPGRSRYQSLYIRRRNKKTRPNMVKIETTTFRVDFARVVENSTQIENFMVSL